jgi:hypothetical protein
MVTKELIKKIEDAGYSPCNKLTKCEYVSMSQASPCIEGLEIICKHHPDYIGNKEAGNLLKLFHPILFIHTLGGCSY